MLNPLRPQFEDLEQQSQAGTLGIWVFLATEVLFFGGLFLIYTVYRYTYSNAFDQAASNLDIRIGTLNTAILLTSSLCMALAIDSIRVNRRKSAIACLIFTELLGLVFLGFKALEYSEDIRNHLIPGHFDSVSSTYLYGASLFYLIYYIMTGLHAVHLTVGLFLIGSLIFRALKGKFSSVNYMPVEVVGLYWHFVDLVWIFLYPLLYLIGHTP